MHFIIVVFPVPGPPVIILILFVKAFLIAFFWTFLKFPLFSICLAIDWATNTAFKSAFLTSLIVTKTSSPQTFLISWFHYTIYFQNCNFKKRLFSLFDVFFCFLCFHFFYLHSYIFLWTMFQHYTPFYLNVKWKKV